MVKVLSHSGYVHTNRLLRETDVSLVGGILVDVDGAGAGAGVEEDDDEAVH